MNATDELLPMDSVLTMFRTSYRRDFDRFEVLQHANICIRDHIGAILHHRQFFVGEVRDNALELPCNTYWVESVQQAAPEFQDGWTPSKLLHLGNEPIRMVQGVEYETIAPPPQTVVLYDIEPGFEMEPRPYVPFTFEDGCLIFDSVKDGTRLQVVYKRLRTDKNGDPLITRKMAIACAAYYNFIDIKAGYYQKIYTQNMHDTANEEQWKAIRKARVGQGMSQNEMDMVFNVMASWNRRRFGLPVDGSFR